MKPSPVIGVTAAVRSLDQHGIRGTEAELGRKCGVTRATIANWRDKGIPLDRLMTVHGATKVPLHVLRPDYKEAFAKEFGLPPASFFSLQPKAKAPKQDRA